MTDGKAHTYRKYWNGEPLTFVIPNGFDFTATASGFITEEGKAYYDAWNGGHIHTAAALDDKAATCTEDGYTGRTFCEVCNSVVEWGTTVKATGHTYEVEDGVLKCKDCDKLFNGELDGKTYVDGIALDGWVGDKYYKDGAMFTGVKAVDGVYYDFGKDGNSKGTFTGNFTGEDGKHYYAKLGSLVGGWFTINDEWYYFDETTFAGVSGEMKFFNKEVSHASMKKTIAKALAKRFETLQKKKQLTFSEFADKIRREQKQSKIVDLLLLLFFIAIILAPTIMEIIHSNLLEGLIFGTILTAVEVPIYLFFTKTTDKNYDYMVEILESCEKENIDLLEYQKFIQES